MRQALGLLSPGFTVSFARLGGRSAQPLVGDWDGDGRDEPGWYRNGRAALQMTRGGSTGSPGSPTARPVTSRWPATGTGTATTISASSAAAPGCCVPG